jgi:glycosyltransferase involved in cell wall biosynthesis
MRACSEKYPSVSHAGGLTVIPNGFDEDDFAHLPYPRQPGEHAPLHLVHAGVLYRDGRNPLPLFEAVASLKKAGGLNGEDIRITLRASGSEGRYAAEVERLGISDIIRLAPFLPYKDALAEQARADGLLLFQGPQFDHQIPAKLYEYIRIGRPIFALVGEHGDTAELLRGIRNVVSTPIDDAQAIKERFVQFVRDMRSGQFTQAPVLDATQYSRRHTAGALAALLNHVTKDPVTKRTP